MHDVIVYRITDYHVIIKQIIWFSLVMYLNLKKKKKRQENLS